MADTEQICAMAEQIKDELICDRRTIHAQPELAFQEEKTSAFVQARLQELGIEYKTGYAKTGVVGLIRGKKGPGRTLLLRADMDGLPIQEANDVPYRSKVDGRMHACGHDSHVAMLLGTAKLLKSMEQEFCGTVKLMFQPAEEGAGGAEPMIEDGLLENPDVDAALALHVEPTYPCGKIAIKSGALMAAPDEFDLVIRGKGGHGAYPHKTVDPILTAAKVVGGPAKHYGAQYRRGCAGCCIRGANQRRTVLQRDTGRGCTQGYGARVRRCNARAAVRAD